MVNEEGGLEILSSDEKASLGINEDGFLKMISMPGFIAYNEDVLVGQFLDQALLASLAKSPADNVASEQIQSQLKHFVSWKLLKHEYVANRLAGAVPGTKASSNNLVIGVCDAEDVKFGYGIEERVKRILTTKAESLQAPRPSVYSLMTNPTAKDSLSYTAQLRLSLAYEDKLPDMRPLADYIWFSEYPEIKLLTNMQNPIDAEGQRPAGESSIFGVF